ncbi:MAG: glycosyltransferase, partial [Cyclobacteriaceae bacterium]|nr:glycosyltransferase [Cyclobacteriaceae bacterium]
KIQGLSNVNFHGYLKGLSLERVTGRCKVALILNTWDEPFGRTFAEALARGQAIVAYDRGMASEFIFPGKNGSLRI